MNTIAELALPHLPMDEESFAEDPFPHFDAARQVHPFLATCPYGFVVTEYRAMKELLSLDHILHGAYDGIVDIMGARGTEWGRFEEQMINSRQGDDHTRLRKVLAPAFTPQQAEKHRGQMRRVVSELLDEWAPRGTIDFEEFASYFPISVTCGLIGAPRSAIPGLRASLEAFGLCLSMDRAHLPALQDAMAVLDEFVHDLVARRRAGPPADGDKDLLAILLETTERGEMTDRELHDLLIFLFVAGYDTSKNAMTIMMDLLLDRPEVYRRCAEDHAYCRKVVDEAFRYVTIATIPRVAVKHFEYRDVAIPEGTMLFFPLPIAGRDPQAFDDAEKFDPERPDAKKHLGFGQGVHVCLGQFIARAQIQEALHQIARRMRNPRRAGPSGWRPFFGVWGLKGLPIEFDPAEALEEVA